MASKHPDVKVELENMVKRRDTEVTGQSSVRIIKPSHFRVWKRHRGGL